MGGRRMTPVGDRRVVGQEGVLHDLVSGCSLAIREESPPKLVGKIGLLCNSLEDGNMNCKSRGLEIRRRASVGVAC